MKSHPFKTTVIPLTIALALGCIDVGSIKARPVGAVTEANCPGCARLSVPLTAVDTGTKFAITFSPVDLTGGTVTFRICTLAGKPASRLDLYAQNGESTDSGQFDGRPFSSLSTCAMGFQDVVLTIAPSAGFDPSQVATVGVRIGSVAPGPWEDPTVVLVDSITVSNGAVRPWQFDTSASPLAIGADQPVAGSTVTWVGPMTCQPCLTAPGCSDPSGDNPNLVSGLESGCNFAERRGGRDGGWFMYAAPQSSLSADPNSFVPACAGANGSCYSACLTGFVAGPSYPYAGLGLIFRYPKRTYDLSSYQGVSFYVRGNVGALSRLRLEVPSAADSPVGNGSGTCIGPAVCGDSYQSDVPGFDPVVQHGWEKKVINFSSLHQIGYGTPEPWAPATAMSFEWVVYSTVESLVPGNDFQICIDQVELIPL